MASKQNTTKSAFGQGLRDCAPFILVAAPFATLFGVAATELGLDLIQTMTMTILVIAGAAQFTALILLEEEAPTFIIILTALAVNLRMAMYSAALAPHLGRAPAGMRLLLAYLNVDQTFALASAKYLSEPTWTIGERCAYFIGAGAVIMPFWVVFSFIGAFFGAAIPAGLGLDFAMPICFISIIGPLLRTLPHISAAIVSVGGALAFSWVPFSLGLIIAATLAMMTGAVVELLLERRRG